MTPRAWTTMAALIATLATGCLDSVVGGACQPGWVAVGGACAPAADAAAPPDAAPPLDAPSCATGETWCGACVDLATDPDHCGACANTCGSGVCSAAACVGAAAGHVVLIGHDYRVHHGAAARLLGNAAGLGATSAPRVALVGDDPALASAARAALTSGLAAVGHAWTEVDLGGAMPTGRAAADVVVLLPRATAADASFTAGAAARPSLDAFVAAGGTVVGLDGPGTTTVDFVRGAGLLAATAGGAATGGLVTIAAPADALAIGVPSPYLAELGSTWFTPDGAATTVVAQDGAPVVLHLARAAP